MPAEFWDESGEEDKERVAGSEDLRGEKVMDWEREVDLDLEDDDEDVNWEASVFGVRDALARVWRNLEEKSSVVWRKPQRQGKARVLDDGHDGDL